MKTYLKTAFTKPKEIYIGRNMKNSNFFSFILLMAFLLTTLSLFQFFPALQDINQDFSEIKNSIPDFDLAGNELESDHESFIYQTDSMLFYFDPDNKMTSEIIEKNMDNLEVPVSTGLLNKALYINFLGQGYSVSYANIENLTTQDLKTLILNFGNISPQMMLLMIVILYFSTIFIYLYQLLPIALFANVVAVFNGLRLRLFQTIKMTVLASAIPSLFIGLLDAFVFPVAYAFEIILVMSLIIFYGSITELKNRIHKQQ